MTLPQNDFASKLAVNILTELFKVTFYGLLESVKQSTAWVNMKGKENDFFSKAAESYIDNLEKRYNFIRILGMPKPVPLRNIFVRVNFLEKITSQQRRSIENLEELYDFDRRSFSSSTQSFEGVDLINKPRFVITEKTIDSLQRHDFPLILAEKLRGMVNETFEDEKLFLKSVKTRLGGNYVTELKDLILQYSQNWLTKVMILGKPGAGKTTFLKYILLKVLDGNTSVKKIPIFVSLKDLSDTTLTLTNFIIKEFDICGFPDADPFVIKMLEKGNCIILLDGLDEIREHKETEIIKEIDEFSIKYPNNQYMVSCRIAAYTFWLNNFVEVEISDFDDKQIKSFISNWFSSEPKTAQLCWKKLNQNMHILELARIPLLLTLLCLAFEQTLNFPDNRSELYKEAVDALLSKWDSSRRIVRRNLYKNLSKSRKEALFSYVAAQTFEREEYFLPQRYLEKLIADYIQHLPNIDDNSVLYDSETILKEIEAHHGIFVERAKAIYSFSHLTIQEYFCSKYIVDHVQDGTLEQLVNNHFPDESWREVFLLTAGLLPDGELFVLYLKNFIDNIQPRVDASLLLEIESLVSIDSQYPLAISRALALLHILRNVIPLQVFEAVNRENVDDWDYERQIQGLNDRRQAEKNTLERALALCRGLGKAYENLYLVNRLDLSPSLGLGRNFYKSINHRQPIKVFQDDDDYKVKDILQNLSYYLRANEFLVDSLNSECYIRKDLRTEILEGILSRKSS